MSYYNQYYLEHWEREYYVTKLKKKFPEINYEILNDIQLMNLYNANEEDQFEIAKEYMETGN